MLGYVLIFQSSAAYLTEESSSVVPVNAFDSLHNVVIIGRAVNASPETQVTELHLMLENDQRRLDGGTLLGRQNHAAAQVVHVRRQVLEIKHLRTLRSTQTHNVSQRQGRNFGLESEGYQFRRRTRRLGFRYEMGGSIPVLIRLLGLGLHCELSQRGPGRSPNRKRFYSNLISADRLC